MRTRLDELSELILSYPPPFVFVNDPVSVHLTAKEVQDICLQAQNHISLAAVVVNAVKTFSARLFYDSVLNGLANWNPNWGDGCMNWAHTQGHSYNENFDSFLHGLAALHASLPSVSVSASKLIVVIEKAERLKDNIPDLLVPLTRLAELSRLDVTVIFISQCRWDEIRPSFGASPDPYYIDIGLPTKEVVHQIICSRYTSAASSLLQDLTYHEAFTQLFSDYASVVCDVCMPFICDPEEICYVATARWPGFVKPLIDEHLRSLSRHETAENPEGAVDPRPIPPPSSELRMRLVKLFKPSMVSAFEALYPRLNGATSWASSNVPPDDILQMPTSKSQTLLSMGATPKIQDVLVHLPRISKFILLAAYITSINPQRTDLRMFGRGLDEKKRKRRVTRTTTSSSKIAAHLQGPSSFPLDRLIAILGSLLEEYDADNRPERTEFTISGEYTDHELSRTSVYSAISELTKMNLLHRTSHGERLDGPPAYKSGLSHDEALSLARQLKIPLKDMLWEAH